MPLLLSESSLSLGYKPQLTSLTLFAFIICYFCRCPSMSTPEITTPTPFFFWLSKMGHFQPQGQTFHSQIILDFRSLQPSFFFFALLMPCNDTKLMSSFRHLKPHIVTVVRRKRNFHSYDNSQLLKLESLYEWILQSFTSTF